MLAAVLLGSCSKDYLDINQTNPNQTQSPPINGLLATVTNQTSQNVFRAANVSAYYTQQLASPNASSGSDTYDNVDRSSLWYNVYNTVNDSRRMQALAVERSGFHHVGIAKITEAMNMSLLIDFFGDAPYSKAWDPQNFFPAYDKAQDIFNASLALIDQGIVELRKTDALLRLDPASDLIHNGSTTAWIKTGYALKARLLNRLSKTPEYNPTNILAALALAYTSNADDAQVTRFVQRSSWNQVAFNNTVLLLDGWLSDRFVKALNGSTHGVFDPRLKYITDTTRFGDYRGTPNGRGRTGTGTNREESYLSVNGFYSRAGAPLMLVTFAEMKFIEAEATFATDKARSYTAYLQGIAAHMDKIGVPTAEKNAYLANPAVAVGAANFTRVLLFKEKYVAMFLHPEAWTDARRIDYQYKDFTLPVNSILPAFIRRVGYPSTETDRNAKNVPNVTLLTEKLWWDK